MPRASVSVDGHGWILIEFGDELSISHRLEMDLTDLTEIAKRAPTSAPVNDGVWDYDSLHPRRRWDEQVIQDDADSIHDDLKAAYIAAYPDFLRDDAESSFDFEEVMAFAMNGGAE